MTTIFQEQARDIERRRARVRRHQFWFSARRELKRIQLGWMLFFTVLVFIFFSLLLCAAMFQGK